MKQDPYVTGSERSKCATRFYRSFLCGYGDGVANKVGQGRAEIAGTGAELVLASTNECVNAEFARHSEQLGAR